MLTYPLCKFSLCTVINWSHAGILFFLISLLLTLLAVEVISSLTADVQGSLIEKINLISLYFAYNNTSISNKLTLTCIIQVCVFKFIQSCHTNVIIRAKIINMLFSWDMGNINLRSCLNIVGFSMCRGVNNAYLINKNK